VSVIVDPRVLKAEVSLLSILWCPRRPLLRGFPSPARDYCEGRIDPHEHQIQDITSTLVVRVCRESMEGAGISDGDELIVNRALEPRNGSVVAVLDDELTMRRPRTSPAWMVLQTENPTFPDNRIPALSDLTIHLASRRASCTMPNACSYIKCGGGHV
jgi:DNA polymerase V